VFLPWTLPVTVERDRWDWFLYIVSLATAFTALIVFLPWALERRRRPEARIIWALSLDGDPSNMGSWPPDHVPQVKPGQAFFVQVAVLNVGDRASEDALVNFVVPDCFDLRKHFDPEAKPSRAGNPTAGLAPEHRVAYFDPRLEPWTPGNWFAYNYRLIYSAAGGPERPLRTRLLFDISDSRFNRTGRRWLPSFLPPHELGHAPAGEPWPPRSRGLRLRWVRAAPHGRVACSRGSRRDIRDVMVLPTPETLPPPVASSGGA
jgi:hypothetical protein